MSDAVPACNLDDRQGRREAQIYAAVVRNPRLAIAICWCLHGATEGTNSTVPVRHRRACVQAERAAPLAGGHTAPRASRVGATWLSQPPHAFLCPIGR